MKVSYDPAVDALYIRLIDGKIECEMLQLNDHITVNIGPEEQVVGIEILDASKFLPDLKQRKIHLENLIPV